MQPAGKKPTGKISLIYFEVILTDMWRVSDAKTPCELFRGYKTSSKLKLKYLEALNGKEKVHVMYLEVKKQQLNYKQGT